MKSPMLSAILLGSAALPLQAADGGLWSKDGITPPQLGGRLQLDAALFDNDARGADDVSGTEVRRVWVDAQGRLYGFGYKVEFDFADDKSIGRDLYLAKTLGPGTLTLGQFKHYFTLDDRTSSKFITFMERGYVAQALVPGYQVGVGYYGAADSGDVSYGGSVYNLDTSDADAAEGFGVGGRVTYAPWHAPGRVLHVGLAALREHYGADSSDTGKQSYSVKVRTAGHMADNSRPTLLSLANGRNIDVSKYGVELAAVLGALSLQAEYAAADADDAVQEGDVGGWYAHAGWFLTGESRPYDARGGRFTRVKPLRASGAWEVALRYDTIGGQQNDIGGADVRDVEVEALTAALNWYISPHVRAMLNYIAAETRDELIGSTVDETKAVTARMQFDF